LNMRDDGRDNPRKDQKVPHFVSKCIIYQNIAWMIGRFCSGRCAISGLAVPELLIASLIIPWCDSIERRADPTNGLCLNALFDRAFDRGLMTIGTDHKVVVSRRLKDSAESADLGCSLREAEGVNLRLPPRFPPSADALEYHRKHIFRS
jgi:putative restriction endonuclease